MKYSPGKWSEALVEVAKTPGVEHSFVDYGKDTAAEVMAMAQQWVTRFTVVIGTTGMVRNSKQAKDITPGSGVVVRLDANTFGVLTAAHVLRRSDNTKDNVAVTVLAPPADPNRAGDTLAIDLSPRPCTVVGFDNETAEGPDIAIIPLDIGEMGTLERWGIVAYNLSKERWSDEDKAKLREMNPWLFSIINGVRCEASQIVFGHTHGRRGSLAIVATNTQVPVAKERDAYDYLELPSETTVHSYPTHWQEELPGTAAAEIEELHDEGVTRRVWGGTSGAGAWNLAVGTTPNGLPNGKVFAELTGICFYANPDKGCIIAHGTESIKKIVATHIEKESASLPQKFVNP